MTTRVKILIALFMLVSTANAQTWYTQDPHTVVAPVAPTSRGTLSEGQVYLDTNVVFGADLDAFLVFPPLDREDLAKYLTFYLDRGDPRYGPISQVDIEIKEGTFDPQEGLQDSLAGIQFKHVATITAEEQRAYFLKNYDGDDRCGNAGEVTPFTACFYMPISIEVEQARVSSRSRQRVFVLSTNGADAQYGIAGLYGESNLINSAISLRMTPLAGLTQASKSVCDSARPTISSRKEDAVLHGTEGDDVILTYGGVVYAKGGDDIICVRGSAIVHGGRGNDEIYVNSNEPQILRGGDGNDLIYAGNGPDVVYGGNGNDIIRGQGGNDTILSGPGNDWVYCQGGRDTADGQSGYDHVNRDCELRMSGGR